MMPAALLDVKQQIRDCDMAGLQRKASEFFDDIYNADPLALLSHWHD